MEARDKTAERGRMPSTTNGLSGQVGAESVPAPGIDGRLRCVPYTRYSSDNQNESSIEDQLRNCKEFAERKGWAFLEQYKYSFSDCELSGTTLFGRDGFQDLMNHVRAKPKPFDCILADDSSRPFRNEGDAYKTLEILQYYGIRLCFVADGLDSSEPWFSSACRSLFDVFTPNLARYREECCQHLAGF